MSKVLDFQDLGLTGRFRFRCNWRGKMILQVEYTGRYSDMDNGICGITVYEWKDATKEQATQLVLKNA